MSPLSRAASSSLAKFPKVRESTQRRLTELLVGLVVLGFLSACHRVTSQPFEPAPIGKASSMAALLAKANEPGPIEVATVESADWEVDRGGLINLDHPKAKAAQLQPGKEGIVIYFHTLVHPSQGLYLVDTGVERDFRDHPDRVPLGSLLKAVMNMDRFRVRRTLGEHLSQSGQPVRGVLLTHLHLDHVLGMRDLPEKTPVFVGPEDRERSFGYWFIQGTVDVELRGKAPLYRWQFGPPADAEVLSVIDVFGDASLWALWVPGHTSGSVAYLARTPNGPVLFTGDACHTRWGWDNGVEPGGFSSDVTRSAHSLRALKTLAEGLPRISVRLGHQP